MALTRQKTQEVSVSKAENKVMLVTFFDGRGIFHKEIGEKGIIRGSIFSFGLKNSSSRTSVSGKRKLVPLA
jgi:hypothetical protein